MKEKQIIELLQSGNFTIAYHDNGHCCVYEGKFKYDELPENGEVAEFYDHQSEGYLPEIVQLLTKALKGKSETI